MLDEQNNSVKCVLVSAIKDNTRLVYDGHYFLLTDYLVDEPPRGVKLLVDDEPVVASFVRLGNPGRVDFGTEELDLTTPLLGEAFQRGRKLTVVLATLLNGDRSIQFSLAGFTRNMRSYQAAPPSCMHESSQ